MSTLFLLQVKSFAFVILHLCIVVISDFTSFTDLNN